MCLCTPFTSLHGLPHAYLSSEWLTPLHLAAAILPFLLATSILLCYYLAAKVTSAPSSPSSSPPTSPPSLSSFSLFLFFSYLAAWLAGREGKKKASKFTEIYMEEPDPFALTCIFDMLLCHALCMITSIYGYCLYCCSTCKVEVRRARTPQMRTQ